MSLTFFQKENEILFFLSMDFWQKKVRDYDIRLNYLGKNLILGRSPTCQYWHWNIP
jgi:hypothetical protein